MNEPKIRFKGFCGEWKKAAWGDISNDFKYGINAAAIPFDGENKYLRITDIDDSSRAFLHDELTSPGTDLSWCSDYLMQDGDIVVARTGASVGKSYIYHSNDGKVYFAGFLIRMRAKDSVDKDFVFQNTLTESYAKHISVVSQRSGQPGVNVNELKAYELHIPSNNDEQKAIGNFFTSLDAQISASTSRLASLKQVKAASLQAMFPQEGETVPKVRFKGFQGEWKKVKLGECLEISTERNLNNEYGINEVLSVSEEEGVMNQIKLLGRSYAGKSVTNYKVLHTNQVVYTKSPLKAKPYGIVKVNKGETGIVSVLYAVYNTKEGVSSDYIHYYFEPSFRINNYLLPLINKGAKNTMNISDEVSLQGDIMLPKSLEEQQSIASFFTTLDRQITLQSQRLEKLKQIKAACLDKMFV